MYTTRDRGVVLRRVARVTRTTKTVRGRRYRDYYVKIHLPERIAEKVEAYLVEIDEDSGRIVLNPLAKEHGDEYAETS